jgi:hypothetical protein
MKKYNHFELSIYLLSFLTLSLALYNRQILFGFHYDDSFITYRYAVNFSKGLGFVFNEGERVNSASSLLYTLILSTFHYIGLRNIQIVSSLVGLFSGTGVIYLSYLFVSENISQKSLRALILVPLVFSGSIIAWTASGMETIFFMFLILLFFKFYFNNNVIISTIILCLLLITRAESVLIFGAVLITEVIIGYKNKKYKIFLKYFIFGTFIISLIYFWNFIYFESIVPQPVRFKNISQYYNPTFINSCKEIISFYIVKNFVLSILSILSIIMFIYNLVITRNINQTNKLNFLLIIYLFFSVMSFLFGPYSDFNRYMIHTIPIMVYITTIFICKYEQDFFKFKIIQIILIIFSVIISIRENRSLSSYFLKSSLHQEQRIELGKYINKKLSNSELIFSSDIGAISYFAINNIFIDMSGLTSRRPFEYIETQQINSYHKWIKSSRLYWVADTEFNGKISSLEILKFPQNYFNTIENNLDYSVDLYDKSNKIFFKKPIGDGLNVVLLKINKQ